jgi:hypothetical protein
MLFFLYLFGSNPQDGHLHQTKASSISSSTARSRNPCSPTGSLNSETPADLLNRDFGDASP